MSIIKFIKKKIPIYEIYDNGNKWEGNSHINNRADYESVLLFMLDKYKKIEGYHALIEFLNEAKKYYEKIKSSKN